jgi:hypothetical protein
VKRKASVRTARHLDAVKPSPIEPLVQRELEESPSRFGLVDRSKLCSLCDVTETLLEKGLLESTSRHLSHSFIAVRILMGSVGDLRSDDCPIVRRRHLTRSLLDELHSEQGNIRSVS